MNLRKRMKHQGRSSLKRHYVIFVAACLIAAFLSAEFNGSLEFSSARNPEGVSEQIRSDFSGNGQGAVKTSVGGIGWDDVLRIMAEDDTEAGREMAEQIEEDAIARSENGNSMFGRTR